MIAQTVSTGDPHTRLHGRRLVVARAVWLALMLLAFNLILAAIIVRLGSLDRLSAASLPGSWTMEAFSTALASLGLSISFYLAFNIIFAYLVILGFFSTAFVIFLRRSDDWVGLYVSWMLVLWPMSFLDFSNLLDRIPGFALQVHLLSALGALSLLPFFFLFPNGRVVPRAARWIVVPWVTLVLASSFSPGSILDAATWPGLLNFLMQASFICAGVGAQIYRYARVSNAVERQQTKWVVYCGALMALVLLIYVLVKVVFPSTSQTVVPGLLYVLALPIVSVFNLLIPIGIGISVLRYRLWEIDLLINRTLVYVPLTAILAGIFAASISLTQRFFIALTGQTSDAATVLTTRVVVGALDPLKTGLQHLVERRFKELPDPTKELRAMRDHANAILEVIDIESTTRQLLDSAVRAFDAKGGAVLLQQNGQPHVASTSGQWKDDAALRVPLQADGVRFGELAVGTGRGGANYAELDRAALQDALAPVARALALTARMIGVQK